MSLLAENFFGGIGGADLDFGGDASDSSSIKGAVVAVVVRVPVDRSGMSFLRGGSGRVLMEMVGEGGGCHRRGTALIGPVPIPVTEPIFGPSTSTTQSFRSNKLVFHPRLGGEGEGECASLPLNECTLFNGLGLGDGAMVEKDLAVGGMGSSRIMVASAGVSPSSMTRSPKSFTVFGFDWPDFWSLRASKTDILDWMDVEGDMINYVSAQSCPRHPPKSCTPLQVIHIRCTPTLQVLMWFVDFCLLPIGTGPDPSVRRRETIRELIRPTAETGRRVHRRVSAGARKIRIEVQGLCKQYIVLSCVSLTQNSVTVRLDTF